MLLELLIGSRYASRIGLKSALRDNHIGKRFSQIDVAHFQRTGQKFSFSGNSGRTDQRITGVV